tara:strand:- start:88 stop:1374 length:1287 start_codon:yes stop_codon:yes gene_type:complete
MQNFNTKLSQLYKSFKSGNYFFPPNIQRRVVWSIKKNAIPYLESLLLGNAVNPIVLVDIQDSIDYAMNVTCDSRDVRYFENLKAQGYRSIVLDGQNRLVNMCNFLDNLYPITGTFRDITGNEHSVINKIYDNLDPALSLAFSQASVGMVKMENRTKTDLHYVFQAINSGQPLNRMETRNSFPSRIATDIREVAEKSSMRTMFEAIYKERNIQRMDDIQLLLLSHLAISPKSLKVSILASRDETLNDNLLDDFYNLGLSRASSDVEQYSSGYLERTENIILSVAKCIDMNNLESRIPLKQYWALVYMMEYAYDKRLFLDDPSSAYRLIRMIDKELSDDSKQLQAFEAKKAKEQGEKEKGDSCYYWHAAGNHRTATARQMRKNQLIPYIFEEGFKTKLNAKQLELIPDHIFLTREEMRALSSEEESEEVA